MTGLMMVICGYAVVGVFVAFYRITATINGERTQRLAVDVYTDLVGHDWPTGVALAATAALVFGLVVTSVIIWPYFPARGFWRQQSTPSRYTRTVG